jgi:hypothetical protein
LLVAITGKWSNKLQGQPNSSPSRRLVQSQSLRRIWPPPGAKNARPKSEASALRKEGSEVQCDGLLREAISHLEALLLRTEIKGRRAYYMAEIGELFGRLGDLVKARSWIEQALKNYEEIGDVGGVANCLGSSCALVFMRG